MLGIDIPTAMLVIGVAALCVTTVISSLARRGSLASRRFAQRCIPAMRASVDAFGSSAVRYASSVPTWRAAWSATSAVATASSARCGAQTRSAPLRLCSPG